MIDKWCLPLLRIGGLAGAFAVLLPGRAAATNHIAAGEGSATAVLLVILLLGSLTAGLFFASPLRRRLAGRVSADSSAPADGARVRRRDSGPSARAQPLADAAMRFRKPLDVGLDRVGAWVAARGRAIGRTDPDPPLPPMLGGDIFFDDEPAARTTQAQPPAQAIPSGAWASRRPSDGPWSTAPISDEREWPAAR